MPQDLERIDGTQVELICAKPATGATPLQHWTSLSATRGIRQNQDDSAGSTFEQWSPGKRFAEIEISGFEGDAENFSDLPEEGDEIKSLSCETTTAGYEMLGQLADETKYGKCLITEVNAKRDDKPSTWTMKARFGGRPKPVVESP